MRTGLDIIFGTAPECGHREAGRSLARLERKAETKGGVGSLQPAFRGCTEPDPRAATNRRPTQGGGL